MQIARYPAKHSAETGWGRPGKCVLESLFKIWFYCKLSSLLFEDPSNSLLQSTKGAELYFCTAQMSQTPKAFFNQNVQEDRQDSLGKILQKSELNIIVALLEIQECVTSELRPFDWAEELICLRLPNSTLKDRSQQARRLLQQRKVSLSKANVPYAAVSYCCEPSDSESNEVKTCSIADTDFRELRPTRVRDTVLDPAIKFIQYHRLNGFWIDEECLDKLTISNIKRLFVKWIWYIGGVTRI